MSLKQQQLQQPPSTESTVPHSTTPCFLVSPYSFGAISLAFVKLNHLLQLYMIMALMAALLMRLRCFLLRRDDAGRSGA